MTTVRYVTAAAVIAFGDVTLAQADTMEESFGNTVLVTNDRGESTKFWMKADGTYTMAGPNGEAGTGKWTIRGDKVCSIPDVAAGAPPAAESCSDYQPNHKVGDKWTQSDPNGHVSTVEIVKGM
jgi:hypothetical protein